MSVLDRFIKPFAKGNAASSPMAIIETLQAALAKVQQERDAQAEIFSQQGEIRRKFLMEDASTEQILAHDVDTEKAKIAVDKLDEAERQIKARIEDEQLLIDDQEWRKFYDSWREEAIAFMKAIDAAQTAEQKFMTVHDLAKGDFLCALRMDRIPRIVQGSLPADVARIHAKEIGRRARMDSFIKDRRSEALG
jgi:hypothetical protein